MSTEEIKDEVVPKVEAEEAEKDPESEEPQAYFEPVVKLDEVEVTTGEEEEEVVFKMCVAWFLLLEAVVGSSREINCYGFLI